MFALLTFNFNRVSISDLGAMAVIVTTLIGLHHFISFFQVYWGRFTDRYPIFGLRRTPYVILSNVALPLSSSPCQVLRLAWVSVPLLQLLKPSPSSFVRCADGNER